MTKKLNDNKELDKFKLALDYAPVAVFIMDKNWNFEYINPEFERLSGYTSDELLHKNIGDTLYKNVQGIPESRREIISSLNEGKSWKGELLTINKNGSSYWAETTASPYKNEHGEIEGYIVIQNDVTEKKNMELALKESELLYRTLLENSTDGIALTQDSTIIIANKKFCSMIGYTPDELKLIDPTTIIAPYDRERVLNLHYSRMRGEIDHAISYTADFLRKDGSTFTAELGATTISINGQNASYVTMRDITDRLQMEKELAQSLRKYRDFAEMLPQTVYELDLEGRQTYMNKAGLKTFGHTGDSIGHLAYHSIAPEDHERMRENMKKNIQNSEEHTTGNEYTAVRCDGKRFPVIVYAAPIIENGNVTGTRGIIIDISERKAMEDALRKSERRFRELTEMLPQAIYELDANNQPTFMNRAGLEMFGIKRGDGPGNKAFQFFSPEDTQRMKEALQREAKNVRFENGEMLPFASEPAEYTAYRANGTLFPVIIYGTPIVENGNVVGSRGIIIDISERKAMENALRESELKYKTLVENSQDGIMMVREDKMLFANDTLCKMLKYNCNDLFHNPASNIIHPDDRVKVFDILKRRQNGEKGIITDELRLKTEDGRIIYASISSLIVDYQGQPASFYTIHDISKRKAMENALRESEMKYKTLVENSQDGIFALLGDKLHFVNNTFCRMMGYQPEEMYQLNPYQLILESDYENASAIRERRKMGDTSTISGIFRYKTNDGRVLECETYSSVIEIEGQQMSYVTVHDLTETRKMQEQLQQSEKKYRTLINKATDGILITQGGVFKFVNPAFCDMMQYTENELINKPFIEVVDKEHHAEMLNNHRRRMSGESFPAIYRAKLFRKDGSSLMVELNSRTTDFNGNPASFVITRDITDRLKAEEELLKAKTELEQLNQSLEARVRESSENLAEARTQLIRLQKENLQSQFEVLRQQVNPHFLFNSLNVLTSLIKLEPDLAEKFTEHLSKVYRYVLENKDNDLVDLKTELDFLDAYLFLLNIRFMDKIQVCINIDKEKTDLLILPLALQLLIENAIKHNSMSKKNPLCIKLFIDENNFLKVVNNLQERESYIASTGVGLKNIEHRYLLLELPAPEFIKTENEFIAKVPLKKC